MSETVALILSIWGAALATALAAVQIWKHVRDRPDIRVEAQLSFLPIDVDADSKGTKIETKHGPQEVLLTVNVVNQGLRPLQITACVVRESNGNVTQVVPDQLPVVLEPNTRVQCHIQKEWLDDVEVSRFGVVDALGRTHSIDENVLGKLLSQCRELPSNKKSYRRNETGEMVKAFQAKDKATLSKAGGDT